MPEAVLDSVSIKSLLRMAGAEGLLFDCDDVGDRLLYTAERYGAPIPEWHRQQILEQLVLNTRVHSTQRVPFDWLKGDFLDMGLLCNTEATVDTRFDDAISMSPDIIEGMLLTRGADPDLANYDQVFEAEMEPLLAKVEDYESEHGTEFNHTSLILRGAVNRDFRTSPEFKLAQDWNAVQKKLRPAVSVIEEFMSMSQVAKANGLGLKTPIHQQTANLLNLSQKEADDSTQVFRIVTKALGRIPVCDTLRDTIALSRAPATRALREMIDEWLTSLPSGEANRTQKIQAEIKKASDGLIAAQNLKVAGYISGVIAIPISAVGLVNPLLSAIGFGLGCVAVICEERGTVKQNSVKWVGFGSR